MPEDMNLSVNGHSKVPPGFRFHPTEEELLHYYLTKKVASQKIDLDVIRDVDLNKLEPWDIQETCKIGSAPQNDWYFFSHKDKKYPTGTRTNRATAAGFWKATGRDKVIHSNLRRIGMRKTLVFYRGRAPHGQKSDWIMHEYRLDDDSSTNHNVSSTILGDSSSLGAEEGWVVCRVFKKKNYHKALESPLMMTSSSSLSNNNSNNLPRNEGGVLDHLLMYMARSPSPSSCKQENESLINTSHFRSPNQSSPAGNFIHHHHHLPGLMDINPTTAINNNSNNNNNNNNNNLNQPPSSSSSLASYIGEDHHMMMPIFSDRHQNSDWVSMDRLVASQLNGQPPPPNQLFGYGEDDIINGEFSFHDDDGEPLIMNHDMMHGGSDDRANDDRHDGSRNCETGLWNFAGPSSSSLSSSSSDPMCHLSV
ncbi:hypothetical protein ABFS83_05G063600 [Erythranthe nasuta]